MGYVINPITIQDKIIHPGKQTFMTLRNLLDNGERINIDTVINIILQVLCSLSVAGNNLQFTHYNCTVDNILVYKINDDESVKKYIQFKLPIGDVYIKSDYVISFTGLEGAHINISNFKSRVTKDRVIKYWLDTNSIMSKYSSNNDLYTFINSVYSVLKGSTGILTKRIVGHIDKKTIFSILCKKIIDEWDKGILTYNTHDDLIQTYYEMGLSSLRLPSNKRVKIYGCGRNGELIRTRLTYSNVKHKKSNSTTNERDNIDIDDCTWKEIRTIAREFGLKSRGKGINMAFLKKKIREEVPFYRS